MMSMPRPSQHTRRALAAVAVLAVLAAAPVASQSSHRATAGAQSPPRSADAASPCPATVRELYQQVSPTVVSITARSIDPYDVSDPVDRVGGSGVIVDARGLVLTNAHVVFHRQAITVTLDEGTTLPAKLVGADPIFDLAVVQIPAPTTGTLPVARLGDSDRLHVGDQVYAIGNPLGLDQTLTHGLVSSINRILPDVQFSTAEPLIQTDTPINPGNSGGPLVDACGDVVGITTLIIPDAQNIGFAIPIDLIKQALPSLIKDGRVIRPWFGVQGQLVSPALKDLLRAPLVDGFLVETVEPDSPADKAGLRGGDLDLVLDGQPVLIGGDIITSIAGSPVDTPERLSTALQALKVGEAIHVTLVRDGETREIECVLPERPVLPGDLHDDRDDTAALARRREPPPPTMRRRF